jgi:hypothetical protein
MSGKGLNRRQFIEAGATGVAGSAALLTGARGARALKISALDEPTAAALLRMCCDLYPHDSLSEARYSQVVESLDAKAQNDDALARTLREGITLLNSQAGGSWRNAAEPERIAALKRIEDSPFFAAMRSETVAILYNDPAVWRRFGYEGPSFPFGGYKNRGFNDIDWINKSDEPRK